LFFCVLHTDSSSDSASHTHSARRPSATALLTRSRGGGLTPPPSHTPTLRHTLSPTGLRWASTLSAKMPLSGLCALERCGLACCGRHGVQQSAPGAGEKPVAFCRLPHSSFVFLKRKLQKLCVGHWGACLPVNVCAEFSSNL